nr:hypothetical protein RSP673_18695 [Ralstonia solanacearum P673]
MGLAQIAALLARVASSSQGLAFYRESLFTP